MGFPHTATHRKRRRTQWGGQTASLLPFYASKLEIGHSYKTWSSCSPTVGVWKQEHPASDPIFCQMRAAAPKLTPIPLAKAKSHQIRGTKNHNFGWHASRRGCSNQPFCQNSPFDSLECAKIGCMWIPKDQIRKHCIRL